MNMKKVILSLAIILAIVNVAIAQDVVPSTPKVDMGSPLRNVQFDLQPKNVQRYIGKATKEEFEKVVGSPVGTEEGCVVYEVENTYGNLDTALRCTYSNNILVGVRFGTPHWLGYWLCFSFLPNYSEKTGCRKIGEGDTPKAVYLKVGKFACDITDIQKLAPNFTTAIINYHVIK